jgi:hypothetical protein
MNNINISDNDIICTRGVFSNLKFLKRLTYAGNPLLKDLTGRTKAKKKKVEIDVKKFDHDVDDSHCEFALVDDFMHYG